MPYSYPYFVRDWETDSCLCVYSGNDFAILAKNESCDGSPLYTIVSSVLEIFEYYSSSNIPLLSIPGFITVNGSLHELTSIQTATLGGKYSYRITVITDQNKKYTLECGCIFVRKI